MKKNAEKIFICDKNNEGKRLDIFLMEQIKVSRSEAKKFISNGLVLLNGKLPKKAGQIMKEGYEVLARKEIKGVKESEFNFDIEIIADADDYVVINKPAGLLVHPTDANEPNTLVAWILENYPKVSGVGEDKVRPGIVHRLDKDASGVMVIAKTQKMFESLKDQFKNRTVEKEYGVLVHGLIDKDHDKINFEINRGMDGRMVSRPKIDSTKLRNVGKEQLGKEALTEYWIVNSFTRFTLLRVKIHTGRTHQIRVHMLAFNHPVVGDKLYFNKKLNMKKDKKLGRLFLHSKKLCFDDLSDKRVCYDSDLPEELNIFLNDLN